MSERTKYQTDHARVYRTRGKASAQSCVDCNGPARHWAHRHDTDPADPANYDPRCVRHHHAYDSASYEGIRWTPPPNTPENRAKISAALKGREITWRDKISEGVHRAHVEGRGRWARKEDKE